MYFLRKVTSHFLPKEKKNVFDKKNTTFLDDKERPCPSVALFEKTIFSESLKKILFFRVSFLRKISIHFPPKM